jgi:hypothetical protein
LVQSFAAQDENSNAAAARKTAENRTLKNEFTLITQPFFSHVLPYPVLYHIPIPKNSETQRPRKVNHKRETRCAYRHQTRPFSAIAFQT